MEKNRSALSDEAARKIAEYLKSPAIEGTNEAQKQSLSIFDPEAIAKRTKALKVEAGELKSDRTLTFGEKAVGISFNPVGYPKVNSIKREFADVIDSLNELRTLAGKGEAGRMLSIAITEAQTAQMWAVKAVTWVE